MVETQRMSSLVGITNARLSPAKRGVAVEIAARSSTATERPRVPDRSGPGRPRRPAAPSAARRRVGYTQAHEGHARAASARARVVRTFARLRRVGVGPRERGARASRVAAALRVRGVDAPSRTGFGVGIADVLLDWLDAGRDRDRPRRGRAGRDTAATPSGSTRHRAGRVDVRVLAIGDPVPAGWRTRNSTRGSPPCR